MCSKVADRPHPITISFLLLSTVLSPVVGLVAVYISLRSLGVTEKNMEIGQRAYLTVTQTAFSTSLKNARDSLIPGLKQADHVLQLRYSFVLHNVGNTPGKIADISTDLRCPSGWRCYAVYHNNPALIGPRSDIRVDGGADAVLTTAAFERYAAKAADQPVEGKSHIEYFDEFKRHDSVDWCWREDTSTGSVYSFRCVP